MLTISSVAVSPVPPQAPTVARVQPTTPVKVSDNVAPENQGVTAPVTPAGEGSRAQVVYAPSALPPVNPTGEAPLVSNFNNPAMPERMGLPPAQPEPRRPTGQPGGGRAEVGGEEAQAAEAAQVRQPDAERASPGSAYGNEEAETGAANGQPTLAQRAAEAEQRRAERGPEVKNPALEAMDTQIKELLPNMWKASRAAVDMLIGEEARAAAAARAELLVPPKVASPPDRAAAEAAESYVRTASAPERPAAGVNLDRLV
jgi:hypothetical protein